MRDPHVGLVLQPSTVPWPDETLGRRWHRESSLAIRRAARDAQVPLVQASFYPQTRTPWVAALDTAPDRGPTSVQDDLSATIAALASLYPRTRPVARPRERLEWRQASDDRARRTSRPRLTRQARVPTGTGRLGGYRGRGREPRSHASTVHGC